MGKKLLRMMYQGISEKNVIPEEASRRSNLLTSQSRLSQNKAQLERLPLIREAVQWKHR